MGCMGLFENLIIFYLLFLFFLYTQNFYKIWEDSLSPLSLSLETLRHPPVEASALERILTLNVGLKLNEKKHCIRNLSSRKVRLFGHKSSCFSLCHLKDRCTRKCPAQVLSKGSKKHIYSLWANKPWSIEFTV